MERSARMFISKLGQRQEKANKRKKAVRVFKSPNTVTVGIRFDSIRIDTMSSAAWEHTDKGLNRVAGISLASLLNSSIQRLYISVKIAAHFSTISKFGRLRLQLSFIKRAISKLAVNQLNPPRPSTSRQPCWCPKTTKQRPRCFSNQSCWSHHKYRRGEGLPQKDGGVPRKFWKESFRVARTSFCSRGL